MEIPTDRIAAELRERILRGELSGGFPLRQSLIASEFGVSRIPVREALSRLEAEGLVVREHNRGCAVASLSIDDLLESIEIRKALEMAALRHAIPKLKARDVAHAEEILARYARATRPDDWTELNLDFHLALYRPAGMPRLLRMIEDLIRGADRYLRIYISSVAGRDVPMMEHRAILDAARGGDARRALRLLESHIERTRRMLVENTPHAGKRRPAAKKARSNRAG